MRSRPPIVAAAVAGLLTACSPAPQTPVPVTGTVGDLAALAGHWEGTYSSVETGRSGSISFTLTANRDSAFGDVVMIPRGLGRPLQAWNNSPAGAAAPRSAVLTINFVRVAGGRVTGTLAPYADPETGVQLFTAFEGQLRGDVIEGTYTTRADRGLNSQTGQWKVTRGGRAKPPNQRRISPESACADKASIPSTRARTGSVCPSSLTSFAPSSSARPRVPTA